jgi:hypothetical protein
MWFKHDGAPLHCLRTVRQCLNQTFSGQWIGRGGSFNWPTQSPDPNTLDFWLWENLKILMYLAPINDIQVLQQQAENTRQVIRVKLGVFDRVHNSVWRRAESCVEMHGNHMLHLLYGSCEHRPYLIRHWFLHKCWLEIFAHLSEYYTSLKPVIPFLASSIRTSCITRSMQFHFITQFPYCVWNVVLSKRFQSEVSLYRIQLSSTSHYVHWFVLSEWYCHHKVLASLETTTISYIFFLLFLCYLFTPHTDWTTI